MMKRLFLYSGGTTSYNYHGREPTRLYSNITIEQYLEKKHTVFNPTKYKT